MIRDVSGTPIIPPDSAGTYRATANIAASTKTGQTDNRLINLKNFQNIQSYRVSEEDFPTVPESSYDSPIKHRFSNPLNTPSPVKMKLCLGGATAALTANRTAYRLRAGE